MFGLSRPAPLVSAFEFGQTKIITMLKYFIVILILLATIKYTLDYSTNCTPRCVSDLVFVEIAALSAVVTAFALDINNKKD